MVMVVCSGVQKSLNTTYHIWYEYGGGFEKMPSLSIYLPNDLFELVKESPSRTVQKALRLLQEKEKQSEEEK